MPRQELSRAQSGAPPRAVIYTRVSRGQQETNTSLAGQYAACAKKAQDLGAEIVQHYEESHSGGLYLSRKGIQAALADIEAGRADTLIVFMMSRAGRDVGDLRDIRKRVRNAGGQLVFADGQQFEPTAVGDLMYNQISAYAEYERAEIREKLVRGLRAKATSGKQPARGYQAYGYRVIQKADVIRGTHPPGSEGDYEIVESEAHIGPAAFETYRRLRSFRETAIWLDANGIRTRSGSPWRPSTVRSILINPLFKGEAHYSSHESRVDEKRLESGRNMRYARIRPKEDWIVFPAPALVSAELFDEVQEIIACGNAERSGPKVRRYLLTGLVFCHRCGRRMYSMRASGKEPSSNGEVLYLVRCSGAIKPTPHMPFTCDKTSFSGSVMERLTIDALEELLCDPRVLKHAMARYEESLKRAKQRRESEGGVREIRLLRRDIEKVRAREMAAAGAAIEARIGGKDYSAYEQHRVAAAASREEMEKRLAALEVERATETVQEPAFLQEASHTVIAALRSTEVGKQEKAAILASMVEHIYPIPRLEGDAEMQGKGRNYNTRGVRIVLKTARPGPVFVLSRVITGRGSFNRPLTHETHLEIQASTSLG